jgi:hypothetical protein
VFPDDPAIQKLIFLKPVFSAKGYLSLKNLKSMDLSTTTPTGKMD